MMRLALKWAEALRECDALATSADSLAKIDTDTESVVAAYSELTKFAVGWAKRVFKLRKALAETGYTVALDDLEMYVKEFGRFVEYGHDRATQLGVPYLDTDFEGDTDNE